MNEVWLELHGRISVDISRQYMKKWSMNVTIVTLHLLIRLRLKDIYGKCMKEWCMTVTIMTPNLLSRLFLDNTSYLYIKEWSITVPHVTIVLLSRVILHNMYSHTMNNFSNIKAKKPHRIVSGETAKLNISILFKKTWKSVLLLGVYIKK